MKRAISLLLSIILMLGALSMTSSVSAAEYNWAGSWGTPALESGIILGKGSALSRNGIHLQDYIPANSTVRTVITPTLGGTKIRLKFSNVYGTEPVTIDEVTVAKTGATNDLIKTDTVTNVTFNGGNKGVTIAVGSEVLSDEINFKTTALEKISVSMFFDKSTPMYVIGLYGGLSYICTGFGGNRTHNENMTRFATKMNFTSGSITYYTIPFLTRVDVYAEDAYSVVLLVD